VAGSIMSTKISQAYLVACYWRNGAITKLTDSSSNAAGYGIVISNNDVYVAGYNTTKTGEVSIACYWKNGKEIDLTKGATAASASSIAIYSGSVYVAGEVYNSQGFGVATVWKNGVPTQLSDGKQNAYISAIAINNGDIYLAGTDGSDGKIWKNGTAATVSRPVTETASLSSIAVLGSDVYAAGFLSGSGATYWQNNAAYQLANTYQSYASGLAVNQDGVYVAGNVGNVGQNEPNVWIDDEAHEWQTSFSSTNYATGMAVNGQDVYVAGNFGNYAGYWRNGTAIQLSNNASANAIALVVH
jgi:hypothetical protein